MCNCVDVLMGSYSNQVQIKPHWKDEKIGVDLCIIQEIQDLWSKGITTTGCCCGHNLSFSYIGVIEEDIEKMKKLGYRVRYNMGRPEAEDSFISKSVKEIDMIRF